MKREILVALLCIMSTAALCQVTPTPAPLEYRIIIQGPYAIPTPTPEPTVTPIPTPLPTAIPTPTPSPTAIPTASPTPTPTAQPTTSPTATPTPIAKVYDSTGKGHDLYIVGNPIIRNGTIEFDGIDDYAYANHDADLNPTAALSISVRANFHTTSEWKCLVSKDSPKISYWLGQYNGRPALILSSDGTNYTIGYGAEGTIAKNKWIHLIGVYDGQQMRLYIDGQQSGALTAFPGKIFFSDQSKVVIAESLQWKIYNNIFDGVLDDVRIYNKALTVEEIRKIYEVVTYGYTGKSTLLESK